MVGIFIFFGVVVMVIIFDVFLFEFFVMGFGVLIGVGLGMYW